MINMPRTDKRANVPPVSVWYKVGDIQQIAAVDKTPTQERTVKLFGKEKKLKTKGHDKDCNKITYIFGILNIRSCSYTSP